MASLKVGVVGVGNIGGPMAMCLIDKGLDLTVCDRSPAAAAALEAHGAALAATPRELADTCQVVVGSLPNLEASQEVALGENGVVHGRAVRVYVETSTLGSAAVGRIADGLAGRGVGMVDAPISGGPGRAREGKLAIMAAGAGPDFEQARPVLEAVSADLFYLGPAPGVAQVAKVINNHISAAGRLAAYEGLAMGIKAGLDPHVLTDVLNAGTARNNATLTMIPKAILTKTFKLNNPLTVGLKDEALLLEEAARYGASMWTGPRILEFYREAAAAGYRDEDSTKVFLYIQSKSHEGGAKLSDAWKDDQHE